MTPRLPCAPSLDYHLVVRPTNATHLRSFFFFQAEDGIRDLTVTGVQTCALPISERVGLVVGRILDVVEDIDRGQQAARHGCAMIDDVVTELLDVPGLVRRASAGPDRKSVV